MKKEFLFKSKLYERIYKKDIKISNDALAQINVAKDEFHDEWNC